MRLLWLRLEDRRTANKGFTLSSRGPHRKKGAPVCAFFPEVLWGGQQGEEEGATEESGALPCCVTSGKLPPCSGPQFLHL